MTRFRIQVKADIGCAPAAMPGGFLILIRFRCARWVPGGIARFPMMWYILLVKRLAAIALMSVLSFLLIAPAAFAQNAEAQLPACCRLHGKHRCVRATEGSPAAALQAANEPCPMFPRGGVPGSVHPVPAVLTSGATENGITADRAAHWIANPFAHVSLKRTAQRRGPPAVIS